MAPYRRPSWFFRHIANPLWTALGFATTLAVPGRTTGEWRTVAIHVLELDGARYLVAPRGDTEWVRNLRASGTGEIRRRGSREPFHATDVPVEQRPPIIAAYRERWDREVFVHFKALPDAADHPVFRIESA